MANNKWNFHPLLPVLLFLVVLAACFESEIEYGPIGPAGPAGPIGPAGPAGDDATASQEFTGSGRCGQCHEAQYDSFILSGHPQSLTKIENGQPPVFPYDAITGGVLEPPSGLPWEDISYAIGGFKWKALFIDRQGHIVTGDAGAATQFNFANDFLNAGAAWVPYSAGEEIPFTCGRCHTTGYQTEGHQDNLEGIVGTWEFSGVQCEACHGPGSRHTSDPGGVRMVIDRSSQMCGECHIRGDASVIEAADGFERHNQQYNDLFNSKHFAITCVACHDPHASAVFADSDLNPNQGMISRCENCHWQNTVRKVRIHARLDCIDCHMPRMAVSAQGNLDLMRGDIRSHQFAINFDPNAPQFREDGSQVMPYLTLNSVCGQCHNGEDARQKDPEELAAAARGYHDLPTPTPEPLPTPEVEATATPGS